MGRFAEQAAEASAKPKRLCRMGRTLAEEFDETDIEWFVGLAADKKFTEIMNILGRITGPPAINYKTMAEHAHGRCGCPDGTVGKGVVKVGSVR